MFKALILFAVITLVPGSNQMWTDGTNTWIGPSQCAEAGFLIAPDSPALDQGEWIEGFHCPSPGPDPSGCAEWSGLAPDIGACERVEMTAQAPAEPGFLIVTP